MVMRAFTKRRSSNEKPASSSDWYIKQFEVYYDADENQICPEGIEKLCTALGVEPSDVLILVLAWVLEAQQMGYITRDEWAAGQSALGDAASPEGLLDELKSVYAATRKNREQLRNLHRYTHKFCRDDRKKNIDVAVAIPMLTLLHGPAFSGHVPNLCGFLEKHDTANKRGVSADEWSMMLNFFTEVKPDCSNYQDDGAWPLLLDDYVEWRREQDGAGEVS